MPEAAYLLFRARSCAARASMGPPRCNSAFALDALRDALPKQAPLVDAWLPRVDDTFIPLLAGRVDAAEAFKDDPANANPQLPQLLELNAALQQRVQARFERARDQLETLLGAGEINKLDAQLCALVRKNELDAGMFYVLSRNMADAKAAEDEETLRILTHVHTRLQEELEKKTEPALALLHKLTRLDDPGIRGRVLRDNLSPKTSLPLPDGSEMPLAKPTAAGQAGSGRPAGATAREPFRLDSRAWQTRRTVAPRPRDCLGAPGDAGPRPRPASSQGRRPGRRPPRPSRPYWPSWSSVSFPVFSVQIQGRGAELWPKNCFKLTSIKLTSIKV